MINLLLMLRCDRPGCRKKQQIEVEVLAMDAGLVDLPSPWRRVMIIRGKPVPGVVCSPKCEIKLYREEK